MIALRYTKKGSARFISHIDLLRHEARIIRRAQIPVRYSNGFNPHALVFFSPPLALGVGSKAEYIAIDSDISADDLMQRYNAAVPQSLHADRAYYCVKNPNFQGRIVAADYIFPIVAADFELKDSFEIKYTKKGEYITEDVRDKVYGCSQSDGKLVMRLAAGNINLRPDRVLATLNTMCGTKAAVADILKIAQYFKGEDGFIDVDDALCTMQCEAFASEAKNR